MATDKDDLISQYFSFTREALRSVHDELAASNKQRTENMAAVAGLEVEVRRLIDRVKDLETDTKDMKKTVEELKSESNLRAFVAKKGWTRAEIWTAISVTIAGIAVLITLWPAIMRLLH